VDTVTNKFILKHLWNLTQQLRQVPSGVKMRCKRSLFLMVIVIIILVQNSCLMTDRVSSLVL